MHKCETEELLGADRARHFLRAADLFYGPPELAHETLFNYLGNNRHLIHVDRPSLPRIERWYAEQEKIHKTRLKENKEITTRQLRLGLYSLFQEV